MFNYDAEDARINMRTPGLPSVEGREALTAFCLGARNVCEAVCVSAPYWQQECVGFRNRKCVERIRRRCIVVGPRASVRGHTDVSGPV